MNNLNNLDDAALDEAIDPAVMKQLWKEYIKNKKASPNDVENEKKE